MSSDYWLTQVRLKGNAYGAHIGLDRTYAVWALMSYADPDFRETLKAFDGLREHAEKLELSRERLDQFIIGTLRGDLNPLKPDQATHRAIERHLRGETPEFRMSHYGSILSATPETVKKVLMEHLSENAGTASFCVLAGRENLGKIADAAGGRFRIVDALGGDGT
jgi:Zn-dependent M16 (insulinase) family peptidase